MTVFWSWTSACFACCRRVAQSASHVIHDGNMAATRRLAKVGISIFNWIFYVFTISPYKITSSPSKLYVNLSKKEEFWSSFAEYRKYLGTGGRWSNLRNSILDVVVQQHSHASTDFTRCTLNRHSYDHHGTITLNSEEKICFSFTFC